MSMDNVDFNRLLDTAMRRDLTAEEEARLRACFADDLRAKAVWEEEMELTQLLHRLPDAPLATNFTAQVLQTVEREARSRRSRAPKIFRWFGLRSPAQQFAAACSAVVLVALGYWLYETLQREKMADSLADIANNMETVSDVTSLSPTEPWKDFDAINRLPQQADEQLRAVLEVAVK